MLGIKQSLWVPRDMNIHKHFAYITLYTIRCPVQMFPLITLTPWYLGQSRDTEGSVHNLAVPLNNLAMLSPKLNASASVSTAVKTAGQRKRRTHNKTSGAGLEGAVLAGSWPWLLKGFLTLRVLTFLPTVELLVWLIIRLWEVLRPCLSTRKLQFLWGSCGNEMRPRLQAAPGVGGEHRKMSGLGDILSLL